jgi:hypothetical protein
MEDVRAAMKTRHLEADQWLNRKNSLWVPEDGDSCHKTRKIDTGLCSLREKLIFEMLFR